MRATDRFAQRSTKLYNGQDVLKNHFLERYPILYTDNTNNYEQVKQYAGQHDFIWLVDKTVEVLRTFPWHFKPTAKDANAVHLFPYVYKKSRRTKDWHKVKLVPTDYTGNKTVTQSHICGIYDVYCGENQFDIFFLGSPDSTSYKDLIAKFPQAVAVENYAVAQKLSSTDMFWLVPNDVKIKDTFKFNYEPDEWSFGYTHVFGNGNSDTQDGMALFPKDYNPTDRELSHRFYANKKQIRIVASTPLAYEKFKFKSYSEYTAALTNCRTEMFWYIPVDVKPEKSFDFALYFDHHNQYDRNINHVFLNGTTYDGVVLFSKNSPISEKEFNTRFIVNKKEHNIVASNPCPYEIFSVNSYSDYLDAKNKSKTEMFWAVPDDVILTHNLDLYFDYHNQYDRNITHVFLNKDTFDGIALHSKNIQLSQKEVETRFYINKKEWNIVYSTPVEFEQFDIDTYEQYLTAMSTSKTELFWMTSKNILPDQEFLKQFYIDHHNVVDRNQNHAFVHQVGNNSFYNGVFLCSKNKVLTKQEIEYRHLAERKEWNTVASEPVRYDVFIIDTYEEYLTALKTSTTEMFWSVPGDVEIDKKFKFDLYFDHSNEYDRKTNHVMLNASHRDGIVLFSKHSPVSKKEVETRFYINKKEWNIVASNPRPYDQFVIDNYDDYEFARRTSKTEMFWMIPPEVTVADNFKFDLYFDHHNRYDRSINHVFKNGKAYDGISLLSTKSAISKKEISMRFFTDKKTYETVASNPLPYDIVFISKDEAFANENFNTLTTRFPNAKRVSNVVGIHQAHIAAAKLCNTDMFWVVDGDAEIIDNFHFDYYVPCYDPDSKKTVHVWKAMNPINNLIYGYGAVKLLPKQLTLDMDTTKPDMTTSISPLFKSINRVSNITKFNTDEFSTWRSAFRECVKLSSKTINGQLDEETEFRLNAWCTRGKDKLFGDYCIAGAKAGKLYGEANAADTEKLSMINDFVWLEQQFKKSI